MSSIFTWFFRFLITIVSLLLVPLFFLFIIRKISGYDVPINVTGFVSYFIERFKNFEIHSPTVESFEKIGEIWESMLAIDFSKGISDIVNANFWNKFGAVLDLLKMGFLWISNLVYLIINCIFSIILFIGDTILNIVNIVIATFGIFSLTDEEVIRLNSSDILGLIFSYF